MQSSQPRVLEHVFQRLPTISAFANELFAQPLGSGHLRDVLLQFMPSTPSTSTEAMAVATSRALAHRPDTLRQSLTSYWQTRCSPVDELKGATFSFKGIKDETPCYVAGHCLCCSEGLRLKAFRNSVLHALKRWPPRNSVGRELLVDGFLVLRFKGRQPAVAYGDWSDDSDCADDLFRFLHVSQQVLIPLHHVLPGAHLQRGGFQRWRSRQRGGVIAGAFPVCALAKHRIFIPIREQN